MLMDRVRLSRVRGLSSSRSYHLEVQEHPAHVVTMLASGRKSFTGR